MLIPVTKIENSETDAESGFRFNGYDGQPVHLKDYGVPHPAVYNLSTMKVRNNRPVLYEHSTPVGHTTKISKETSALDGEGMFSIDNNESKMIQNSRKKGFPWEMSMGLDINNAEVVFLQPGETTVVNGHSFKGPMYVLNNTELVEMTITKKGRAKATALLSEDEANIIRNSEGQQVDPNNPVKDKLENSNPATPPVTPPVTPPETPVVPPVTPTTVPNSAPQENNVMALVLKTTTLMNKFPDHKELIQESLENGMKFETVEKMLNKLENSRFPGMPDKKVSNGPSEHLLAARFDLAMGVQAERLAKTKAYKDEILNQAENLPTMTLREMLCEIANSNGGRFSGHSDIEAACKYLKGLHNSGAYSTVNMPNFFLSTAQRMKEQIWEIEKPFAVQYLKEVAKKDFRPTDSLRASGGQVWDEVKGKNKLNQTEFGTENYYRSTLTTFGQLLIIDRPTIINDDMDVISDMMTLMVEGAVMRPDMLLMDFVWGSRRTADFSVSGTNYFTGSNANLTRTNLSTIYNKVRKQSIAKGDKNWRQAINSRWLLVTGIDQEETAWELVRQERIVNDTTANTKTGSKNYWYERLTPVTWNQIGNTSMVANASETDWMIIPENPKYAPHSISYLGRMKKPTIEEVDLPAEMLGWGIRGYFDVDVNEREPEAIAICRPSL